MNKQIPLRLSQINLDNVVYKKKNMSNNRTIINVRYNDNGVKKPFVFQTCSLYNKLKPKKYNNYWEFNIPLYGKVKNKVTELISFLKKLDSKIILDAKHNNSNWFNNKKSIKYRNIINVSDTNDPFWKNGSLSFKIPIKTSSTFKTRILRNNKHIISIAEIDNNNMIKCALELYAIIIKHDNFYAYLRPVVISYNEKLNNYDYKLLDSDSSESEDDKDILETEVFNSLFIEQDKQDMSEDNNSSEINIPHIINTCNGTELLEIDTSMFSDSSQDLNAGSKNKLNLEFISISSTSTDETSDDSTHKIIGNIINTC